MPGTLKICFQNTGTQACEHPPALPANPLPLPSFPKEGRKGRKPCGVFRKVLGTLAIEWLRWTPLLAILRIKYVEHQQVCTLLSNPISEIVGFLNIFLAQGCLVALLEL